jgi:adenylate cyclase
MAREIERKFLVVNNLWRNHIDGSDYFRQGYLATTGKCSIRIRVSDDKGFLNMKSATLDIQRTEYEYEIPRQEAEEMLDTFCEGPLIEKTRYYVRHDKHLWEIDEFDGANAGLVVAEIELDDIAETFTRPDWIGPEVSDDPRYYNVCLVKHPYNEWDKS